jgi:hypothetical protein
MGAITLLKPLNGLYPTLRGNLGHRSQKMVLGTPYPDFNPEKVSLFVAKLSCGGMIAQISLISNFSLNFRDHTLRTPDTSMLWRLRTPGRHRPVVVRQRKV